MNKRLLLFAKLSACFILLLISFSFKNIPSRKYRLEFFTSHNQFYLCDSAFTGQTGEESFWTEEANTARLALADDIIGIKTESYGHIKAELAVLDEPDKETDLSKYDHVVEGGVKISSGILEILNFPEHKIVLKAIVTPGRYRVRICSINLKGINPDEDEGSDHYKIEIWQDSNMERKVLKQYMKN